MSRYVLDASVAVKLYYSKFSFLLSDTRNRTTKNDWHNIW
jgi:hypothetical protein